MVATKINEWYGVVPFSIRSSGILGVPVLFRNLRQELLCSGKVKKLIVTTLSLLLTSYNSKREGAIALGVFQYSEGRNERY